MDHFTYEERVKIYDKAAIICSDQIETDLTLGRSVCVSNRLYKNTTHV